MKFETLGPNGEATIYLGDCLEILPTLTGVDAVVTDPPYGIGYKHGEWSGDRAGSGTCANERLHGDDKPFDPSPLLQYENLITWGGNIYADRLPSGGGWLIWDKRDGMTSNYQADAEVAWTNVFRSVRMLHHRWNGMHRATEKDIRREHPTQKPIAVIEWCLGFLPNATTILDPFMGSGTTGVACANLGRRFIGIEIEPKYYEIARKRISEAYAQGRLFNEPEPQPEQGELL